MAGSDAILSVLVTSVGLLFLYAGVAKLFAVRTFAQSLLLIPYVPYRSTLPIAVAMAFTEAVAGLLLTASTQVGRVSVAILLVMFASIAMVAIARRQRVPCNCFGTDSSDYLSHATVVRNAVLLCVVAVSAWKSTQQPSLLVVTYAALVLVLYLAVNKVRQNHQALSESAP
jgi:uncharacterized membrane protein YphA (DoxX/SURF4 family)